VLVLLIIFMLTSIAIVRASMVVNLPKAATGGARLESTVNIVCNKDGTLMLNGATSSVHEIGKFVKRESASNPKLQAVIAADKGARTAAWSTSSIWSSATASAPSRSTWNATPARARLERLGCHERPAKSKKSERRVSRIVCPARKNPFVDRRARKRDSSRARMLSHVRVPIHAEFHEHRGQRRMPGWLRASIGITVLLVSVGLHVGFVIMAFGVGKLGAQRERDRERLAIEMREHEAEKPKPPEPEKPTPEPKKEIERPTVVKAPPAPKIDEPPPKEPDQKPPARIVGLSFESTVGDGDGDGPSFAVGNTRLGETDKVAVKKDDVPKDRPPPVHGTEKRLSRTRRRRAFRSRA